MSKVKTTKKVAPISVSFVFMKHNITLTARTLDAKIKNAAKDFPPRDASNLKHQIFLPKSCGITFPVGYLWVANHIFDCPTMVPSATSDQMRGSFNPGQVVGTVNRHLTVLGMRAVSDANVAYGGVLPRKDNGGKTNGKAPNLAQAQQRAINAHKRLIENMNKREVNAAKARKANKARK